MRLSRSCLSLFASYNFESKEQHKLTNVLNEEIHPEDLVTAKVIRYKSFDGTEIPAIYYLPHQANKDKKVRSLLLVSAFMANEKLSLNKRK